MADTVKIGDISSQLTKASRLVLSTDGFWIQTGGDSQGNGQSVLIPAEFVRAYLTNGISPSIGEDGNWYINGKNLGVKAEGVTPQLRGGTLGIEVSYDKGQTWKTAVLYSDMDIDLDELEKQYKKIVEGEQQRVEHENTRISNENTRQANEQTRQSKVAASITNANDAAAEAKKQAESASAAAAQANGVATNESNREQSETERKAAEAQRKTDFQSLSDSIASQLAEMKRLQDSILNAQSVAPMASVPASIYVKTERTANVGDTINIAPTLFAPSTCNHSVIYKVYSGGAKVDYKGDVVLPSEAGDSVIEVIPALNNGATKVVTIHAVAPTPILDFAGEQITDENGDPITA